MLAPEGFRNFRFDLKIFTKFLSLPATFIEAFPRPSLHKSSLRGIFFLIKHYATPRDLLLIFRIRKRVQSKQQGNLKEEAEMSCTSH